jgi:hypothetical protein
VVGWDVATQLRQYDANGCHPQERGFSTHVRTIFCFNIVEIPGQEKTICVLRECNCIGNPRDIGHDAQQTWMVGIF